MPHNQTSPEQCPKHAAYQNAKKTVSTARETEYAAFSEATRRLIAAGGTGHGDLKALIDAIHLNKSLWGMLAGDCANDANALPHETRAAIISLANWVTRYSSDVMRKKESVEPLIDVNRMIMEGLAGKAPAA